MIRDPSPRRGELADFLRARRARLAPAAIGIEAGGRRRVEGLRREEVAQLAGISPTWYAWAEQGRAVSMSLPALGRLAAALQLGAAERAYLFDLAGKSPPEAPDMHEALPPTLARAVEAIPSPAYLLDRLWNALAWNPALARLFVGWPHQGRAPNLLRYVLSEPAARTLIRDWDSRARRIVAEFRADIGAHLADPEAVALVGDLRAASPFFAQAWEERRVLGREGGERLFDHPEDGPLRFEQIAFNLATQPSLKLVMLVPATLP